MTRVVVLLVLLVACPGTPPGNFVRDAASGEIVKSGAALCAHATPRGGAVAPDAAITGATLLEPVREVAVLLAVRHPPRPRDSLHGAPALGARAPPGRG